MVAKCEMGVWAVTASVCNYATPTPTPTPTATPTATATGSPTPTPTATPTATPGGCAGQTLAYTNSWGYQCGGTLACVGTNRVKEDCGDGSFWLSINNGTPVYHDTGGSCRCFTADTRVTMADGSTKAIAKIVAGEKVRSYDDRTHESIITTVVEPIHHKPKRERMYEFELADGRVLRSNNQHPMFVAEYGTYVVTKEIAALHALGLKLSFRDESGASIAIRKIRTYTDFVATYNLSVDGITQGNGRHSSGDGHNYYVEGVLAHNLKATMPCN
jgi:hypothetical protein